MNVKKLSETTVALLADHKGLFAMDESISTCNKRFADAGIPQTEENRRIYRELIIKTSGLNESISGVILYHETIRQRDEKGIPFITIIEDAGIIPGIKVDIGMEDLAGFPGEMITEGLDGLRYRLKEYARMGARFAKWRAAMSIGQEIPSRNCIISNANALARYAALCQECGLVPIVEPEVMMPGSHSSKTCYKVTREVLTTVFDQLYLHNIALEAMILKPNMILPGENSGEKSTIKKIAEDTVKCLMDCVPASVPGITFLSGGQDPQEASARLNAMNQISESKLPWKLTFSFGRALQQTALAIWEGDDSNKVSAQQDIYHRAKCNRAANMGLYNDEMERRD
ncbi:class I fructose-bisphosphate aldolase [Pedobacter fastidiosus]|uniref:fructose-bisphosphate aldolase n=1 Tax=Pedobacter fastidiosus TaxID=2765361 RepID=A0ABR7KSA7_9SPHI|nr:class I fructose-bisphosphate aldolase [Pedobacter fastidiosus]MBC6110974.1 fructose-bisphosphate aldolase class I [Pedobacter fastidiosus]